MEIVKQYSPSRTLLWCQKFLLKWKHIVKSTIFDYDGFNEKNLHKAYHWWDRRVHSQHTCFLHAPMACNPWKHPEISNCERFHYFHVEEAIDYCTIYTASMIQMETQFRTHSAFPSRKISSLHACNPINCASLIRHQFVDGFELKQTSAIC